MELIRHERQLDIESPKYTITLVIKDEVPLGKLILTINNGQEITLTKESGNDGDQERVVEEVEAFSQVVVKAEGHGYSGQMNLSTTACKYDFNRKSPPCNLSISGNTTATLSLKN